MINYLILYDYYVVKEIFWWPKVAKNRQMFTGVFYMMKKKLTVYFIIRNSNEKNLDLIY